MKKCDYCGKEIDYFDQYCDIECQSQANKFFELREKYEKLFSVIDMICVFGIPIGFLIFTFLRVPGMILTVSSFIVLGIMIIILPFPTENMIYKYKLKRALKYTRFVGCASVLLGIIAFIFMYFF